MKIVGKFYYEDEDEYTEAEKVSGYRWATEIKNGNLVFAVSIKKDVRPLDGKDFSSHQSYDVFCYFPLKNYDRITKSENGFSIMSNENSSCKKLKTKQLYQDKGNPPFKPNDKEEYCKGFDFVNEGNELSDEDISLLDDLLKRENNNNEGTSQSSEIPKESDVANFPSNEDYQKSQHLVEVAKKEFYTNGNKQAAILKCNEALSYEPHNADAFELMAYAKLSIKDSVSPAYYKSIIDDCNKALKFGILNNNGKIYFARGECKRLLKLDYKNDFAEAWLAREDIMLKICTKEYSSPGDLSFCNIMPLSFSLTYSNSEPTGFKVSFSKDIKNNYEIVDCGADRKWNVIIVFDYDARSFWYAAIKKEGENNNVPMTKVKASEFIGNYLLLQFTPTKPSASDLLDPPEIFIDLKKKQDLSSTEEENLRLKNELHNYYTMRMVKLNIDFNKEGTNQSSAAQKKMESNSDEKEQLENESYENMDAQKLAILGDQVSFKNPTKALELYKISARKGNDICFLRIAYLYGNGQLGAKNIKVALEWYLKASDELYGNFDAMIQTAEVFQFGKVNTPVNLRKALEYYERALNTAGIQKAYRLTTTESDGSISEDIFYDQQTAPPNTVSIFDDISNRVKKLKIKLKLSR